MNKLSPFFSHRGKNPIISSFAIFEVGWPTDVRRIQGIPTKRNLEAEKQTNQRAQKNLAL